MSPPMQQARRLLPSLPMIRRTPWVAVAALCMASAPASAQPVPQSAPRSAPQSGPLARAVKAAITPGALDRHSREITRWPRPSGSPGENAATDYVVAKDRIRGVFGALAGAGNGKILRTSVDEVQDHPGGGCRMSDDAGGGVVDAWGRTHDHENLFVVGSTHHGVRGLRQRHADVLGAVAAVGGRGGTGVSGAGG